MNFMKKRGFTLVEVMSVIVVLSIIALITVPAVLHTIEKARKESFRDSVYETFSQVQYYLVKNNLEEIPEEGIDVTKLDFKNNNFVSGVLALSDSKEVKAINIGDVRYCAIGVKDKLTVYDGACDLTIPTCELSSKEPMGASGWYAQNPTIIASTMPVISGFLEYGIGVKENYSHVVEGTGKVGTAEYATTGDESLTVYCYVRNLSGTKGKNEFQVLIDKTSPTEADFSYSTSGKDLTLVATGVDAESGIARYSFSIDNGETWTDPQSSNTYVFTNLDPIIYSVMVRVYNGTYVEDASSNLYKDSEAKRISMAQLQAPTYTISPSDWTVSNVDVTVNFEKDGAYLVKTNQTVTSNVDAVSCSYVLDGEYTCEGAVTKTLEAGVWYRVTTSPTLTYTENGSVIAQVSDGINYVSGSSYNISNIDREKPVAYVKLVDSVLGNNNWYRSAVMEIGKESSGLSGISKVYYCMTSDETCEPTIETTEGKSVSIVNNNVGQRVCGKVVSTTGIESDVVCSDTYMVDSVAPTASFSMTGVTCSDNYAINPSKAGTSWTLSGTSNITKTYVCEDMAGNTYTASRTYYYNSCKTGSNTCKGGYNQVWNDCASTTQSCTTNTVTDYDNCTQYKCTLYKSCTLYRVVGVCTYNGNKIGDCYDKSGQTGPSNCQSTCSNACKTTGVYSYNCTVPSSTTGRQSGCGTETVYGSACNNASSKTCNQYGTKTETTCTDVCKGGYVNGSWNSCISGSNTCQGGFQ